MAKVDERDDDGNVVDKHPKVKVRLEDGSIVTQPLPPITQIKVPVTGTKSAKIRWLRELGYTVSDISNFLGCKYQMVRNVTTTIPKRAAREDLPEQVVEYLPEKDPLDDAMDGALEASLMAGRKARQKELKDHEGSTSQRRTRRLMQEQRWIKILSPGEFRGEGTWTRLEETNYDWEAVKDGNWLPVYEGIGDPNTEGH